MYLLADREKKFLLRHARRALAAAVNQEQFVYDLSEEPAVQDLGGAFVTLLLRGRLRGCIGQLPSGSPLPQVVAHCARAVASEDPRFRPVLAEDLPDIEIELSVLSDPEDASLQTIRTGEHGLIVSQGARRGLLLPQVATQFRWDAKRFLEETCEKAGLRRDAWASEETRIQTFTAEVFGEKDFPDLKSKEPA